MILDEYKHINALHKLLGKIRYNDKLDSDEIDFFATSPLIVEIHEKVYEEWIKLSKERGYLIDSQINNMNFEFDSHTGQMLKNRIDNWNDQMIATLKKWTVKEVEEYSLLMIRPLKCNEIEQNKLIRYIYSKIQ